MLPLPQRLALGIQAHQAGRLKEAEALYRGVLAEDARNPHALHLLGLLAHQDGRHREATELISRALAIHGPQPAYLTNLAAAHLALDQVDQALATAGEAVRLGPNLADAHNNLGVALRRLGRLDEAETAFRAALRLQPGHADARASLGVVLHRQGRLAEAFAILAEAVRLAPAHAQTRNDLGGLLLGLGRPDEAFVQLQEAVRLRPNFPEALANLGMALHALVRPDEAVRWLRESVRVSPGYARGHDHLAYVLESQGKLDEALAEYRESARLAPDSAMALAGLAKLAAAGRGALDEAAVRRMADLADRPDVAPDDQARLHHALATWLDSQGSYDEAFEHCRQGNELRKELELRRGAGWSIEEHRRLIDRIVATFTPEYFRRVAPFGAQSELPVFVVGMFRSGSTLVEQVLARHPAVFAAGEITDFPRLMDELPARLGGDYPEALAALDGPSARSLAEAYLQAVRGRSATAARVVDKFLSNYFYVGAIAALFPKARIVHCLRDPLDTCLSCYFQNFGHAYLFKMGLRDLGLYYREYERLMAHWSAVLPAPMFALPYEGLTDDLEGWARRLVAFCGLEWDNRCLSFTEAERPVRTASILQVRRPLYRTSVGRWKRYEKHLGPLIEALRGGG
jgi:tetratricopeptide (TPR) repeat protein